MAGKRRSQREPTPAAPRPIPAPSRLLTFLDRRSTVLAAGLVLLASLRIVATYTVFNHTMDEPAHIACGMEWLDRGVYRWEPQHPPLARVLTAIGPYLLGIRSQNTPRANLLSMWQEGTAILYRGQQYDRTLAMARLGILPFFWIACAAVYLWARRLFGRAVAVLSLGLFTFLPPVLAHAGLATTDMALTALLAAAFVAAIDWLERPTPMAALRFGGLAGLMTLSKFSALVFFPAGAALALAGHFLQARPAARDMLAGTRVRLATLGLALAVGGLVIWAGYRFSFGDVGFAHLRLPAPELFAGLQQVKEHNAAGHAAYLLGARSQNGFWDYYLVALAVKTPLAFLALLGIGMAMVWRRRREWAGWWTPLAFSGGVVLVALFSNINIGIRHILPVYCGFSVLAAVGLAWLLESADRRQWAAAAVLAVWLAASSLASHPDYLPYFNELAGSQPEKILVDSDLDWGQDHKRLERHLDELGVKDIAFDRYLYDDPIWHRGFPTMHRMNQDAPSVGWNVVGVSFWKSTGLLAWPDRYPPRERVGSSFLLWYFNPAAGR
jgi:4-amino-4-deoxy-L-arabinose transferase-like glycosyltransferase